MDDAERAIDAAAEAGRQALEATRALPGSDDKARAAKRLSDDLRHISETASSVFKREVRRIHAAEGSSYGRIARRLGVSKSLIFTIVTGSGRKPQPVEDDTVAEPSTAPEPEPVVAAIVASHRGVLIARRNDGKPPWTFIAGKIEPGESPADAAVREVKEETGLRIRAGGIIGRRVHPRTGRTMVYMAAAPTHGTDAFVGDEDELAEVRWVSLAEADSLMGEIYEPVRQHLKRTLGNGDMPLPGSCLPPAPHVAYRQHMEGPNLAASPRLACYYRTHDIYQLEGVWYAWKPTPSGGELTHARTSDELADKLAG